MEIVTSWNTTTSDSKVPSEKLAKTSLDGKAPTQHASSSNTYGVGSTSNYGHVKTVNGLTQGSHSDGTALSAYQGKVLKDLIDAKPSTSDIPTKTSDLTNDGDGTNVFVKNNDSRLSDARTPSSHTHGNISNDGKVGTTSGKPLITTTSGLITTGSFGTASGTFAQGNHTHSEYVNPTIVDNLNSTSATSVLSARQGKVLGDLIGDAITYINQ